MSRFVPAILIFGVVLEVLTCYPCRPQDPIMSISACRSVEDYSMDTPKQITRPAKTISLLVLLIGVFVCATAVPMLLKKRSTTISFTNDTEKVAMRTIKPSFPIKTPEPTYLPSTGSASLSPSQSLSMQPSVKPSLSPSIIPSDVPSSGPSSLRFYPGELTLEENGLLLSKGLVSRIIASTDKYVLYANGSSSTDLFHPLPDFGATFEDPNNPGGWIYVSNSEVRNFTLHPAGGGVGAFTFDAGGRVTGYRMLLTGTTANCGGGRTPWGAWISCEEHDSGKLWQVDPTGERTPSVLTLGKNGGAFESFAYDIAKAHYFVTEDAPGGSLRRFIPSMDNSTDPWDILLGPGQVHFLLLFPNETGDQGHYSWTDDRATARENSRSFYQHSEGIDIAGRELRFVSKNWKSMFILHLDNGTYYNTSTVHGRMDGAPDQLQRISDDDDLLFFTEEGGKYPGGESFFVLET